MDYSITPDDVVGRRFYTKIGETIISTVHLPTRDKVQPELMMFDAILGRNGDYETAILAETTRVVASSNTIEGGEANHRRAVENLIDGVMLDEVDPPMLKFLQDL